MYTTRPTGTSIWRIATDWTAASAPVPTMSKMANAERSKMPADSRMARCSALMIGDHQRASHSFGRVWTPYFSTRPAFERNHCGRSQPATSKNSPSCSSCHSCIGDLRSGRSDRYCSAGWTMPYVFGNASNARAFVCWRVFWWPWKRLMSDWLQSISGSPWTIHSAMDLPTAGPSLTHTAAADQRPLTSGVSPRSGMPSGVRAMRPLIAYFTPTDSSPTISGMSVSASSIWGSKSSCVNGNSVGDRAASSSEGISSGSCRIERWAYDPISSPMPSWRSYMRTSMSRTIGKSMARAVVSKRGTGPTSIIWWTAGVSGMRAPAISAMSGDQTPQAMTTYSASMVPFVVSTVRIRPPSTPSAVTSVLGNDVRAPIAWAFSRQSVPNWSESQTPTPGV